MRKSRIWLQHHGGHLLVVVGLILLANGIAGHLNGVEFALPPDGRQPGKIAYTPVWFLDLIGLAAIWAGIGLRQKPD